ncbi:hypothetical protein L7F22_064930 [Adiantum nelumboides]|nr:hypothetical protein [Adiantum nelumboides]
MNRFCSSYDHFCFSDLFLLNVYELQILGYFLMNPGWNKCKMLRQKTARQWDKAPYDVDELSTNEKSHIPDEVLAQIPAHIFIAKFRNEEGDNIKTTVMPREIWTLHQRPEVASAVRAVHLEQFSRLPPWGTDYMRTHEFHGKAMLTDSDGAKVEVLITKDIINEALQFIPGAYDLIPKTKAIDNEKAFLKVKGSKFKYSDLIYSELELPLRLISQHLRVQKPPRYTEPFLHMAVDLPAASSQAALIQQAKYVPKAVRTTSSTASSRSTRSKKSSSEEERTETDKEQDSQESSQEDMPREVEAAVPSEYESDEEDTSIPLERKSQKPRAAKAAKKTKPMTMKEARKIRIEKAKDIQKERRRIEAEEKAQKEAKAAEATQTQEKKVVDLSETIEYLKKLKRDKHTTEQRAAQLAREKIKEALSRKAEEPVLEPTQGNPKRPRQEEEENIEHIQADPILPSPINIPPASPSSPITPFPPAFTPQTLPSPSPLDIPKSPPAPTSPQQQPFSAEPCEIPTSLSEETAQPMDKTEGKQTDREQHQPTHVDVPILIIQKDEPTNEEAIQEVKSFEYTKFIQTLFRTALELVTKERDSNAKENKNLLRDLIDLQSQLTRKEAQKHELIKNKKKMKEQLKYEDARFQKLNAFYNTVKNTLTALLQNQEPTAATPSTSDSAAANTLAALQEELQTEKL